jgi:hypothetical protein
LVAVSLRRSRSAWRAWAFYVVVWAIGAFIVGNGRLGIYGRGIAYDPRYNTQMTFILPLTVVLALAATPTVGWRPRLLRRVSTPPRVWFGAAVLAAALAVSVGISYARLSAAWPARGARAWAAHVRSSVAALHRDGVQPSVLDSDVPPAVDPGHEAPFNRLSVVLPMFREGIVVDDETGRDPPALAARDGTIKLAVTHLIASWSGPVLLGSHLLRPAVPVAASLRQGAVCAAAGSEPVLLTFTPPARVRHAGGVLELDLRPGSSDGILFVYFDGGQGYGFGPSRVLAIGRRARVLRVSLPGRLVRARLDVQVGGHVCISALRIVRYSVA